MEHEANNPMHDTVMRAVRGWFRVRVLIDGREVEVIDEANVIVNGAAAIHARLVGGAGQDHVTQIGFGTNGAAPSVLNTALVAPYLRPFDSVEYPAANQVQFNFSLGVNEANGVAIREVGLITASGLLYARKVRASVLNKTASVTLLSGAWLISY